MYFIKAMKSVYITVAIFNSVCYAAEIVNTLNGAVKGFVNHTEEGNVAYFVYYGIPYGEPPLKEKRFEPPVDVKNWAGTLDCTKPKPDCLQAQPFAGNQVSGSEDCLNLNLYVPQDCFTETCPVFVFFHGGGFTTGSVNFTNLYPGHFIDMKIIVVMVKYRLSVLGFLTTCDLVIPGNMGLKDQNCGLRWIQKNIQFFGGDPKKVTIGGESAGAASVGYHEQCPSCAGTFQRTYKQSGNTLNVWALWYECEDKKQKFFEKCAKVLGIDISEITVDFLKNVDAVLLQTVATDKSYANLLLDYREGINFGPTTEKPHNGSFFTGNSYNDIDSGLYPIKEVTESLIAFGSKEVAYQSATDPASILLQNVFGIYYLDVTKFVPKDVVISNPFAKRALGNQIEEKFFPGVINTVLTAKPCDFSDYISYDFFERGIIKDVQLMNKNKRKVYFLRWGYIIGNVTALCPGVTHASYLRALMKSWNGLTTLDKDYSNKFVHAIGNFIITGDPTPPGTEAMFNNVPFYDATYNVNGDNYNMYALETNIANIQGFKKPLMDFYNYVFQQSESSNILLNYREGTYFGPTTEKPHNGSFFTGNSYNDIEIGLYPVKEVTESLISFTSVEITDRGSKLLQTVYGIAYLDVTKFVPKDVIISNIKAKRILGARIKEKFFPGLTNTVLTATPCKFDHYFSYDSFERGSIKDVQLLIKNKRKAYFLRWDYVMANVTTLCPGVPRGVDLRSFVASWRGLSTLDKDYGNKLVHAIGNFIISGNPTPPGTEVLFNNVPFHDATYKVSGDNYTCMILERTFQMYKVLRNH